MRTRLAIRRMEQEETGGDLVSVVARGPVLGLLGEQPVGLADIMEAIMEAANGIHARTHTNTDEHQDGANTAQD